MPRLRLLHVSDLHIGQEGSGGAWRVRRVLGRAWTDNLRAIADDGPVDLVCFTGDIAYSGQRDQYDQAEDFVAEMLGILKLPPERFFCVPGNHDIDRKVNADVWRTMREAAGRIDRGTFAEYVVGGGRIPFGCVADWPDRVLDRQAEYHAWLDRIGRSQLRPEHHAHGRLGWRVSLEIAGRPLHLIGLDSAWLAGDDHDAGKLRLTDAQIGRLLTVNGAALRGPKLVLMHHPLGDLADAGDARRLLAEFGVGLLLHGHLHEPEMGRWATPAGGLPIAAAGCLYEHDRYPNRLQLLDLDWTGPDRLEPGDLWARCWSSRGHWHDDDGLYPGSRAGRLTLREVGPEPATPVGGVFVGRADELQLLRAALMPVAAGAAPRPALVCCAIEGMAGVGKTRLAEQFVQQFWQPQFAGASAGDDRVLRLALDPLSDLTTDAQQLGQHIADRLKRPGPPATLWQRLGDALRGQAGGAATLLLIENVDTREQAAAVGTLVRHLPGCAVLVTARYQQFGGADWARVSVPPLPLDQACALLLAEVDASRGHRLIAAEAESLAQRLGCLPLALHIAASHLSRGLTPGAFLRALQATGLNLEPADPADPRLIADQARAILSSSFELSWRHWCSLHPDGHPWQAGLVAMAHGPASGTGLSLAAAIAAVADADAASALAAAAADLSLLELSAGRQHMHPLIAEFLRAQPVDYASEVRRRMTGWFSARLPQTNSSEQGQAWGEVWGELDALSHWLLQLPPDEARGVERIGSWFAIRLGPFGVWQRFCERLLDAELDPESLSNVLFTLAHVAGSAGDSDLALASARRKRAIDIERGADREAAFASGQIADLLQARGELDEALRVRREEELPVHTKLGDRRERAITMGKIADVLQDRGELNQALRIRREEELPVFTKLGDQHSRAITLGKIADVLQARGELDEALRIRREEMLPVFDKLGDQRSRAVTMGQIADVLHARGELDEALRIRREEQLPVYTMLGDQRSRAVTMGQIADVLQTRGELDEALRIRREEELPVYAKLGDQRSLVFGRTRQANGLWQRDQPGDRDQATALLKLAHDAALRMRLPEAGRIATIYQRRTGRHIA